MSRVADFRTDATISGLPLGGIMKRAVTIAVLILSAVLTFPPILRSKAVYEVPGMVATTHFPVTVASQDASSTSEASIAAFVQTEAEKYGVNPALAICIVEHESQWQPDRIGDVGNPHGESYGLWQIEVDQHADITVSEALDYQQATDWALQKIAAGDVDWWSTFSQKPFYCRNVPVFINS